VSKTALVVEDDYQSSRLLSLALSSAGINCIVTANAPGMWRELENSPDVLILDISQPAMDGMNILRQLRRTSDIPVMLRSTRASEEERITGIETGADDFLPKPCNPRELVARIKRLLRRSDGKNTLSGASSPHIRFGNWILNKTLRELSKTDGQKIPLGGPCYALLTEFLKHPGKVLTREQLAPALNRKYDPDDRIIDIYISQIRRILGAQAGGGSHIETLRARGYVFTAAVNSTTDDQATAACREKNSPGARPAPRLSSERLLSRSAAH